MIPKTKNAHKTMNTEQIESNTDMLQAACKALDAHYDTAFNILPSLPNDVEDAELCAALMSKIRCVVNKSSSSPFTNLVPQLGAFMRSANIAQTVTNVIQNCLKTPNLFKACL